MSAPEGSPREWGATRSAGLALAPARPAEERTVGAMVSDPVHLAGRGVRALLRQPWFVAITLVQPVVWLLLFGALFQNVVPAPNGHYIAYLTPTDLFGNVGRTKTVRFCISPPRRGGPPAPP